MPSGPAARDRQATACHLLGSELSLGQGLEGGSQQAVTGQDRGGLSVDHVVGGTAPAQLVVVHGGQIVVNERIGVDHLHRAGKGQGGLRIAPAHAAALQHQHRPDTFAARHQRVLHRLPQIGVSAHLAYPLPQRLLHPCLGGLIVQAKYVLFHLLFLLKLPLLGLAVRSGGEQSHLLLRLVQHSGTSS